MLNDRRFAKLNLDLQRLLQVVAHGEQVFPRVKEKCAAKNMFTAEDIGSMEEIIGRLRRIKENLGYIVNRVTAVQTGLDSWQAEQLNRRLYYLSFLSMIFLPLSIITGIFGMNVGGVPWTEQKDPRLKNGFRNVLLICAALFFTLLFGFSFRALYWHISSWRTQQTSFNRTLSSFSRRTYLKRLPYRNRYPGTAYVQV